jgi:tetratricopeptide (TPR) repeat protein
MSEPFPTPDTPTRLGPPSSQSLVKQILADQRDRFRRGESFRVEAYLDREPALRGEAEAVLDLIYHELVLREARGEAPGLQEYLGRFPQWAEQLRRQFEVEKALSPERLTPPDQTIPAAVGEPTVALGGATGSDYEILKLLGRGGMGLVYQARQCSLGRTVALKMIRDGTVAGAEERLRFRVEAEAVARLQHPNIVQIFEVGERDGQPFLALEYVSGGSLAQHLKGRVWSHAQAAAFIETVARAIHYAHQQGVVHRDLKPANILLASVVRDEEAPGNLPLTTDHGPRATDLFPKIADFGLAKIVRDDGPGLTETGRFLGTPSYAAPEQVGGRRERVGPAADVYSVGAILYEMLTGRPPFQGTSVLETLEQVRHDDPLPPSRLDRKVPRDLETICLKCLQKDPARRYATAALLAEDLRRFQDGRPILARPAGMAERFVKLVRRRPAVSAAVAIVVLALLMVAVGGWRSAITEARLRRQAEADLGRALEAVDSMLTRVGAVDLADVPQMEPVRRDLLLKARAFLNTFLAERGDDPTVRFLAAKASSRLGDVQGLLLDAHGDAEHSYRRALVLLREIGDDSLQARQERARALDHLGVLLTSLERFDEAREYLGESLHIRQALVNQYGNHPDLEKELATSLHDLASVLARIPAEWAEARKTYEQALALQEKLSAAHPEESEFQKDQAHTLNDLGKHLWMRQAGDADKVFRSAAALQAGLVEKFGDVPTYRRALARTWNNLAGLLAEAGQPAGADGTYRKAVALQRELTRDFPNVPTYRHELAGTLGNLGMVLEDQGLDAEAEQAYHEGLALRQAIKGEFRDRPDFRHQLALVHRNLGSLLSRRHQAEAAETHLRVAVRTLGELAGGGRAIYQSDLGLAYHYLAQALGRQGLWFGPRDVTEIVLHSATHPLNHSALLLRRCGALDEARECLERAISWQQQAHAADPSRPRYKTYLRNHCLHLADISLRLRDHETMARAGGMMPTYSSGGPGDWLMGAQLVCRSIALANADHRLDPAGKRRQMELYTEQAIRLLEAAVNQGLDRVEILLVPDFAPLRDRPAFKALLEKLEKGKVQVG